MVMILLPKKTKEIPDWGHALSGVIYVLHKTVILQFASELAWFRFWTPLIVYFIADESIVVVTLGGGQAARGSQGCLQAVGATPWQGQATRGL